MRLLLLLASGAVLATGVALAFAGCGGSTFSAGPGAGGSDAGVTLEGGSTTPDSGTGSSGFCPATNTDPDKFCDDFDDDNGSLLAKWTADPSGVSIDAKVFDSPPDSFQSDVPAGVGVATSHARISRAMPVATRVTVGLDLHIDKVPAKDVTGTSTAVLFSVALGSGYSVGVVANTTQISAFEDQAQADGGVTETTQGLVATNTVLGNWTHVSFDLQILAGKLSGTVAGATLGPVAVSPPTGQVPTVSLGLLTRAVLTETEAHYDNVTITVTTP